MKSVASRIAGFSLLYACFSPVVALAGQEVRKPSGAFTRRGESKAKTRST